MESLTEIQPVIYQGRFAVPEVRVMPVVYLEYLHVPVIQVVAAAAILPPVHGTSEIYMRYVCQPDITKVYKMVPAPIIDLHKGHKSYSGDSLVDTEVKHLMNLIGIVNISFEKIAADIHLLHIHAFEGKRSLRNFYPIDF